MNIKPNYFDSVHEDGQTPSNTPSNKAKGTLNFNMNDLNFNKKVKNEMENNKDKIDNSSLKDPIYCNSIILGKLPLGHQLTEVTLTDLDNKSLEIKTCCKLYCNKCNNKITYISDSKFKNEYKSGKPAILKDCLESDKNYDSFACKCCFISLDNNKFIKDIGYDWECDGHFL